MLNVKALVDTFNQEKALGGAFSVIVITDCETDGSFYSTSHDARGGEVCRGGGGGAVFNIYIHCSLPLIIEVLSTTGHRLYTTTHTSHLQPRR